MRRTRALAAVALVGLAGCQLDLGATQPWVPVTEIEGVFKPELGPLPASAPQVIATRGIPTSPLRVVSFNVQRLEDVDAVADVFLQHPDLAKAGLILLQEVESHPLEGASRTARLADRLGVGYVYIPARIKGDGTHGLAILSPFPILDVQEMELPHANLTVSEARRIAVSANLLVDGKLLPIVDVHLDTVLNVTDRILQLRPAVIEAPATVLVGGDFNTNDWLWTGSAVPILPAHSVVNTAQAPVLDDYMRAIGFETPCAGVGPTEHMAGLEFRLDAFFTRGLKVTPGHVARDVDVSDHWPLWIDVTL